MKWMNDENLEKIGNQTSLMMGGGGGGDKKILK